MQANPDDFIPSGWRDTGIDKVDTLKVGRLEALQECLKDAEAAGSPFMFLPLLSLRQSSLPPVSTPRRTRIVAFKSPSKRDASENATAPNAAASMNSFADLAASTSNPTTLDSNHMAHPSSDEQSTWTAPVPAVIKVYNFIRAASSPPRVPSRLPSVSPEVDASPSSKTVISDGEGAAVTLESEPSTGDLPMPASSVQVAIEPRILATGSPSFPTIPQPSRRQATGLPSFPTILQPSRRQAFSLPRNPIPIRFPVLEVDSATTTDAETSEYDQLDPSSDGGVCTKEPGLHGNVAPPALLEPPQITADHTSGDALQPDSVASGLHDSRKEHAEEGVRNNEPQLPQRRVHGRDIEGRALVLSPLVLSPRKTRKQAQEAADVNARVTRKRKHDRDNRENAKKRKVEEAKAETEKTRKSKENKEADKKGNWKDKYVLTAQLCRFDG